MRMPFGKYKGQEITALSDEYLLWLLEHIALRDPLLSAIEEEVDETMPLPVATHRPKEVSVMTPQGLQTISTDPTDLDEYEGEYKQLATGETFGLKVVEDDPHGRTHHAKNVDHFWAGTADEFRAAFEKD